MRWLFGIKQSSALANPRLEALRRGTVLLRLEHRLPGQEEANLRSHGFNEAQLTWLKSRSDGKAPGRRAGWHHA
jgi:hypothetical protein